MKAIEIVKFMFLFNAFLYIFSTLEIYAMGLSQPEHFVDIGGGIDLLGMVLSIGGVGSIVGAVSLGLLAKLAGSNIYQTIAVGAVTGFFVGIFINTYSVFLTLSENFGEFENVFNAFFLLTGSVFVLSVIWGIAQIGIGGARAYD